jgi:hypothetical protein
MNGRRCSRVFGSFAEEDAGRTVGPVHVPREDLAADDEDGLRLGGLDEAVGHVQAVEEAHARGLEVERGGPRRAEVLLHQAGGRRKHHVARDRPDDDHIDVLGLDVRALQSRVRCLRTEVGELLALRHDVTFLDPRAGGDPFVGRLHELLEIGVGQKLLRNGGADADDAGAIHGPVTLSEAAPRAHAGPRRRIGSSQRDRGGRIQRRGGWRS